MNRRSILRFLGLAPLAALVPAIVSAVVTATDMTPVHIVKNGKPSGLPFGRTTGRFWRRRVTDFRDSTH
jgi:hypothetical protein